MNVTIISPLLNNVAKAGDTYYTMNTVNIFPPVNLLSIGTVLKQKTKHNVKIIDAYNGNLDHEALASLVETEGADIVGIPAHNVSFYDCLEAIRAIKRKCPPDMSMYCFLKGIIRGQAKSFYVYKVFNTKA